MELAASDLHTAILMQTDKALLRVAEQRQENLAQLREVQASLADLEQRLCQLHTEHEALQIERDNILSVRGQALATI